MRKTTIIAAAAFALQAGAALAGDGKAEVIHWWTSGGESAAVKVFADQYTKAGGTWVDTAIAGGANARTAAINRVMGGKPPTAMQFNTGKQFDELVAGGMLADIDSVAQEGNWAKIMPAAIVAAASRNGKFYAVPVNIHGQNWLWYNKAVFESAGAKEPATVDELFVALDKIKAKGLVPLAFSGQKVWERGLFNTILLAKGGNELYEAIYSKRDAKAAASPAFKDVAEAYGKLRAYVDQGAPGRNWNDASAMVIQGKAGMQVMGDWAKGEFIGAGLTAGKEYGCTVIGQGYMMGGDVFAFAKTSDPEQVAAQKLLAKTMIDKETQILFAQKKGSVPVRNDVDASSLDACAQAGIKMLADPKRQAAAIEMLAPASFNGALEDIISEYWNKKDMTADAFAAKFSKTMQDALYAPACPLSPALDGERAPFANGWVRGSTNL